MRDDEKKFIIAEEKAEEYFAAGRYDEALSVYAEMPGSDSDAPEILLKVGEIAEKQGDSERAIENFRFAVGAFTKEGKIINAIAACKHILSLDPARIEILDELAVHYATLVSSSEVDRPVSSNASVEEPTSGDTFPRTPLFSDLPHEALLEVIDTAKRHIFKKGETVFNRGDEGRSVFVIARGEVEIISLTTDEEDIRCVTLSEGDFFGEFSYFSGAARSATVRALSDIELIEITHSDMKRITKYNQNLSKILFDFYKERVLDKLLSVSRIFKHLSENDRKSVIDQAGSDVYLEGMDIVREGEEGKEMYVIKTGSVSVWTTAQDGSKKKVASLKEGDSFGHRALTRNTLRMANVTADTDLEVVVFERPLIEELFAGNPAVKEELEVLGKQQMIETEFMRRETPVSLV